MTSGAELSGIQSSTLAPWLARNLPGAVPPFEYRLIAGGHSNLTFALSDANGRRWVLRRPPLGVARSGAHNMAREHRIQAALAGSEVPVPRMIALCEDETVNGAPFYVMDLVDGVVVDRPSRVAESLPDATARRTAANSLVDALVAMHGLDLAEVGLADLGRRGDYVERQLRRMRKVWDETRTRELPLIDSVYERLARKVPAETRTSLLHCDYRFGNVMLDTSSHRVAAVLDWELATTGDARVDIAFLLCNWDLPEDPSPGVWMEEAPTRAGDFPTRDEILTRYATRSGMSDIVAGEFDYFCALGYWRIAIIAEGIKRRYQSGAMSVAGDIDAIERRIHARAERAAFHMERAEAMRAQI